MYKLLPILLFAVIFSRDRDVTLLTSPDIQAFQALLTEKQDTNYVPASYFEYINDYKWFFEKKNIGFKPTKNTAPLWCPNSGMLSTSGSLEGHIPQECHRREGRGGVRVRLQCIPSEKSVINLCQIDLHHLESTSH